MLFNKNFFHLALGFIAVIGISLFVVFGVGLYDSEIRNRANVLDLSKKESNFYEDRFLDKKDVITNEWPPKPI